jgi:hypothetical protein
MKNFIGGLFKTKNKMRYAYQSLRKAGFHEENIMILVSKDKKSDKRKSGTIRSVATSAAIGALIGTGFAAILGYLIGQEIIVIPGFMPNFVPLAPFVIESYILFLAQGAVTGIILGVAFQLAFARKNPTFTNSGITRGGLVLAVNTNEDQGQKVKMMLKEAGAIDLENLTEKWNIDVWSKFKQIQLSATKA